MSKRGSGSSARAGSGSEFDDNGYYVYRDKDGYYDTAPDKNFEKRLQKYADSWTENEKLDGKDLQIVGTPKQVAYAQDIVKNFFGQFDKREKSLLRSAQQKTDPKTGIEYETGLRKAWFDSSRVARQTKTWSYNMLKGRPIQAKKIIEQKDTTFRMDNRVYSLGPNGYDFSSRVKDLMKKYEKSHKAP